MGLLPPGALPQAFIDDRRARFGLDMAQLAKATPHLAAQALVGATWLDTALADGRAFVGGEAAGHADLNFYSNLWFVRERAAGSGTARAIAALPHLAAWYERVTAIGHGHPVEISGADAIVVAHAAAPDRSEGVEPASGFTVGQSVKVRTDGSGDAPVAGRLIRLGTRGIAVALDHVVVNFPPLGQTVLAA